MKVSIYSMILVLSILLISGCVTNEQSFSEVNTTDQGFIEIGKEYDYVWWPTEVNGSLAYYALVKRNKTDFEEFIVYKSEQFGNEYEAVNRLVEIQGKLAFIAKKNGKWLINYDGQEIGGDYDSSGQPTDFNGNLVYVAGYNCTNKLPLHGCQKTFIVMGGKEIGKEYDSVSDPTEVSGSLAYTAREEDKRFIVLSSERFGEHYRWIYPPIEIGGKLAYMAKKEDTFVIAWDGKEIQAEYPWYIEDGSMTEVNGKLAYVVSEQGLSPRTFIMYDGLEIGRQYYRAYKPTDINGTLAFVASEVVGQDFKYLPFKNFIVYKGREIGRTYDDVEMLTNVGGRLAFIASKNGKYFIVMEKEASH